MEEGDTWRPPSQRVRESAFAVDKARFNAKLQRLLSSAEESGLFEPMNAPEFSDWLANHKESGQTATAYATGRTTVRNKKVYIVPLGDFIEHESPSIDTLQEFAERYLCVDIEVVAPIKLIEDGDLLIPQFDDATDQGSRRMLRPDGKSKLTIQSRINGRVRQLLTGDIQALLSALRPPDAFCMMSFTMEDLYPSDSWNFVFGQASMTKMAGVFSFARYSPYFSKIRKSSSSGFTEEEYALLLRRSCKVMVHEIIHLFGVKHCIYYKCCMNGSNHLMESDSRPVHLCPVDLHKLAIFHKSVLGNTSFDIEERYRGLLEFYNKTKGFEEEAAWVEKVLHHLDELQKD